MKKASIIGAIAFGASLLAGAGISFAQTETPTATPTVTVSPTQDVQGDTTVPQGAPATGRG